MRGKTEEIGEDVGLRRGGRPRLPGFQSLERIAVGTRLPRRHLRAGERRLPQRRALGRLQRGLVLAKDLRLDIALRARGGGKPQCGGEAVGGGRHPDQNGRDGIERRPSARSDDEHRPLGHVERDGEHGPSQRFMPGAAEFDAEHHIEGGGAQAGDENGDEGKRPHAASSPTAASVEEFLERLRNACAIART